jgi:hypothetical protein
MTLIQENGEDECIVQVSVENDSIALNLRRREASFSLAGSRSDLDGEQMEEGLEEIQRNSRPTPPLQEV